MKTPLKKEKVLERIKLEKGIDIDLNEGWRKLTSSQFGGNPGRGFSELIQNALDSYPVSTPWEDKRAEIVSDENSISITDYGTGMNRKRLRLLTTLGGTDKESDPEKIGKFGIGFVSVFNPRLEPESVRVLTRCEGENVELLFTVKESGARPEITSAVHGKPFAFSTKIEVKFKNDEAVKSCLKDALRSLEYYPCNITVNTIPFRSIWQAAKENRAAFFTEGNCFGFLDTKNWNTWITVLCKYEYLLKVPLSHLLTGGKHVNNDLRDFHLKQVPYLPQYSIAVNCNDLSVTISRDSFRLDYEYEKMVNIIGDILLVELGRNLDDDMRKQLILANQYVLCKKLAAYFRRMESGKAVADKYDYVLKKLAEAKIYKISGQDELFSLVDIRSKLSRGLPLFFSPWKRNLRWVGGVFKHDFIVLPEICTIDNGAPQFYDELFAAIFKDVVNLDTIQENQKKIEELVKRKIVSRESLTPKTRLLGTRDMAPVEKEFLERMNNILIHPEVVRAIKRNVHLSFEKIECVYFDSDGRDAYIATGLFNADGKALDEMVLYNMQAHDKNDLPGGIEKIDTLYLGILRRHQIIDYLINSEDDHKEYYTLTYLSHELALCQKHLVPYSSFYHVIKEQLAGDMRKAFIDELLTQQKAA